MRKKYLLLLLIFAITLFNNGCSTFHSIGLSMKIIKSEKDLVFDEIKYLATDDERDKFYSLESEELIDDYMIRFWQKRDPTPTTELNEIEVEYFKRKEIADKRYKETSKGSLTDRGRVLILYGDPERIEFYNDEDMYLGGNKIFSLEMWLYDKISSTPEMSNKFSNVNHGRMKFVFADLHGYGTYNQIYSSEKNEFVDSRVYLSSGN